MISHLVLWLRFVTGHLAYALIFAFASYILGRAFTLGLTHRSGLERTAIAVTLGAGILSQVVMLAGFAGILTWPAVAGTVAMLLLVLRRRVGAVALECAARARGTPSPRALGALAAAVVVAAPILLLALYPPTSWDSTEYYLAAARRYLEQRAIRPQLFLRFPVYTQLAQMHFVLGLMFLDDVAAQLSSAVLLAALTGVTGALALRVAGDRAALWAPALLLSNGYVLWVGTTAYLDIATALFITASFLAVWAWTSSGDRGWAAVAGALAGCAVGTKYMAVPSIAALSLAVAGISVRRGQASHLGAYALLLAALGIPWYAYNLVTVGNPFFPLGSSIFGSGPFSAEDVASIHRDVNAYGIGTGARSLFALPWHLAFNESVFHREAPASVLLVCSLPVVALGALRSRLVALVAGLCVAYTLLWFYTGQILRYLVPVAPLASVAAAASIAPLLDRRWLRSRAVALAVAAGFVAPGVFYSLAEARRLGPLPIDQPSRESFLSVMHRSYGAVKFLNERFGSDYSVYALLAETMPYFVRGTYMGDHFGPARFSRVLDKLDKPQALANELRQLDTGFLLVDTIRLGRSFRCEGECTALFRKLYDQDGQLVFEVQRGGPPTRTTPH